MATETERSARRARYTAARREFTPILHTGDMPLAWGGYIIRPDDEKFSDVYSAPQDSGIYGWYSSTGDLVYIGKSVNIAERLIAHKRSTSFMWSRPCFYSYRTIPEQWILGAEAAHIDALWPLENHQAGRSHWAWRKQMAAAIEQIWAPVLPEQRARIDAVRDAELAATMEKLNRR